MAKRDTSNQGSVWKKLAAGLVGGLAGSWSMNAFQSFMNEIRKRQAGSQRSPGQGNSRSEDNQVSESEEPATVKTARVVSTCVFHHELRDSEKEFAGNMAHYAMGAGSGALYGAVAEMLPATTLGRGVLFGTVLWLIADEAIVPAFGLSKAPSEYPVSTHAYAWASHLVYGITVDVLRRTALRVF